MRLFINLLFLSFAFTGTHLFSQTFIPMAQQAGFEVASHSNSVTVADYDNDGDLDVYIVASRLYRVADPNTWNRLFRNNGNNTFTDITALAGVRSMLSGYPVGSMGNKLGAAWGDYDNDGYIDLFLANYGPNHLFRNNGNGTFSDVADAAGVKGVDNQVNSSAMWVDIDLDGDLDLHVCGYTRENVLYENNGDGTFTDISVSAGIDDVSQAFTALPIDANTDGYPDLYLANDYGANDFFLNNGDNTFSRKTSLFGLEDDGDGMGAAIADYNGDGMFDMYITNIGSFNPNPLFTATGQDSFVDMSIQMNVNDAGWAWGTEFFDFDHDRDLDLYVVNGWGTMPGNNYLFENQMADGGSGFVDISSQSGVDGGRQARGLVVFDYDDDGDQDMLVANITDKPYLYRNDNGNGNWLKVDLEGTVTNRNAYGATVTLHVDGSELHQMNDGVDFYGQSDKPLHFGLGDWQTVDWIDVQWPGGEKERFANISVNQQILLSEGDGMLTGIDPLDNLNGNLETFILVGNYPNPFNGNTHIQFKLAVKDIVDLKIVDILGRVVYTESREFASGIGQFSWNGLDNSQAGVAGGLYFFTLEQRGKVSRTGKMLYIK